MIGFAVNDVTLTEQQIEQMLREVVMLLIAGNSEMLRMIGLPGSDPFDPWCGICGAKEPTWKYEVAWSKEYPDWKTAEKEIRRSNLRTSLSGSHRANV